MKNKSFSGPFADIAARLYAIRVHAGYDTGIIFAEAMGIPYKSWGAYEKGTQHISLPNAKKLVERCGVTLDFIYLGRVHTLPTNVAVALSSILELNASSRSNDSPETKAASISRKSRADESL